MSDPLSPSSSAAGSRPPSTPWGRLAQHAAQAPARDNEMPFGFATRVLAGWSVAGAGAGQRENGNLWRTREIFAWRGAAIALAITLAAVAMNYDLLEGLWYGDTALAGSLLQTLVAP